MARVRLTFRGVARIIIVSILLSSAYNSVWLDVTGKGVYTEGLQREPTIWVNYTVDANEETISTEITNATPLLQYWNSRDELPNAGKQEQADSAGCNNQCLDDARSVYQFLILLTILLEIAYSMGRKKIFRGTSILAFSIGILCILILIPIAAVSDFGLGGSEKSGGGFTTGESDAADTNDFAYYQSESEIYLSTDGLTLEFKSEGFDLALMSEEERELAEEERPSTNDSWIEFEGEITVNSSSTIIYWLLVPFTWYVLREPKNITIEDGGSTINALSSKSNQAKQTDCCE